jgi:hypothetical protein
MRMPGLRFLRRFGSGGGESSGGGVITMVTKLFDVVTTLSAGIAYSPAAAEDVQIDLVAIGADVTITFPAVGTTGQCIGVTLLTVDSVTVPTPGFRVLYAGPVDALVPTPESQGDCQLFTWDGTNSVWRLVSTQIAVLRVVDTSGINYTALPGDFVIDGGGSTVILPLAPADGSFVAIKHLDGTTTTTVVGNVDNGSGLTLTNAGASVWLVWSTAQSVWWIVAAYGMDSFHRTFVDADLVAGVLTVDYPNGFQTNAPMTQLYDGSDLQVQQAYGVSLSSYAVQLTALNQLTVTFDPAILPLIGGWKLCVYL